MFYTVYARKNKNKKAHTTNKLREKNGGIFMWENIIKSKKYPQWDKLGMQDGRGKATYYAERLYAFHKDLGSDKYDVKESIRMSLKRVGWGHLNLDFLDDLD